MIIPEKFWGNFFFEQELLYSFFGKDGRSDVLSVESKGRTDFFSFERTGFFDENRFRITKSDLIRITKKCYS
jgi:hypothetical protein